MDYQAMSVEELNAANDALGEQIAALYAEREKLNVVRRHKLRVDQVTARYKGKVKPEDLEFMRANGLLPPTPGTVVTPGVAVAQGMGNPVG